MTDIDTTRPGGTFSLGRDLTVNRLGFGAMRLLRGSLDAAAGPRDPAEGMAVLRRAVQLGVTTSTPPGSTGSVAPARMT
jgi:pyridoxine 4-dehydrogenase